MSSAKRTVGLRFSNKGFAFAVIEGTRTGPTLVKSSFVQCPKAFKACEIAKWAKHELDSIFNKYKPNFVCIKSFEGRSKGNAYEERVRLEGIAHFCAGELGLRDIARKRKSTIAKDLGLKGRARYLSTFDTSAIPTFDELDALVQEAALVAWSDLKD
jgi:hypothetical protein